MYLNTHSYYSLRYGTMLIKDIVNQAVSCNVKAFALTDINNTTGIIDFVNACFKSNIQPIAGIEFRNNNTYLYTGIAKNNEGFRELNDFLSHYRLSKKNLPETAPFFENAFVVYPFGRKSLNELNENEFTGILPDELRKLFSSEYRSNQHKLLIRKPVTFANTYDYELHRHLRAIDNNILLSQLELFHLAAPDEYMIPTGNLIALYNDYPQIVKTTEKLIEDCSFEFDFRSPKNKRVYSDSKQQDVELLKKLAYKGMIYRYGRDNPEAQKRVQHEIELISKLGFASYFLIAWDIVTYSMNRGIYHVGRGSGANSIVAYCLKITDVEPIELNLYFERFINPKRTSPPGFDIDYSWKDRDKVQDYIFERFGSRYTALLGAISTFQGKSILRELAKTYGLPKSEIDAFIKNPKSETAQNNITQKILFLGHQLTNFPNLRSIHAGGIIVSELPITYFTALDLSPKGYQTTQFDMYIAEGIGFEKFDILSQKGIGHIGECADIVKNNKKIDIDIHNTEILKNDQRVKKQLKKGETIGCLYIESPAMRGLLKKLRCDNYTALVAASSIIRLGVAKSGMMREYINRFHNPKGFSYIHPVMEEQLMETFGVMVYQEDVLKICHHFAGLDLADADVLRRLMSGKPRFKNEFQLIADKFFANCKARGYPEAIIKEVWRQIKSFAGYAFSKAHSASYAVESYQSLYLKAYFPVEFMVAVINNFVGFYHTPVYFNEARGCGADIELPCVNQSNYKTRAIGNKIYTGFIHLKSLEIKIAKAIVNEREENGLYSGLCDFISRVSITLEQLKILIRINAFRFSGKTKSQLLWEAHLLLDKARKSVKQPSLFPTPENNFQLPESKQEKLEDAYDEIEFLEFPVTLSYFDLLKTNFRGEIFASQMLQFVGQTVRMVGWLINIKHVWTSKGELMHFGCFIDERGDFFDTVHFSDSLKIYPFRGKGVYLLLGRITSEFDYPGMTVSKMAILPVKADPRA